MRYSEMFYSHQGEIPCGVASVWLRFALCNLQCRGFGRSKLDSAILAYQKDIPLRVEDFRGDDFNFGCDSAYSWDSKFKSLWKESSPIQVAEGLISLLPNGTFKNEFNPIALTFTGGEPLLKNSQSDVIDVLRALQLLHGESDYPIFFETNGTCQVSSDLVETLQEIGSSVTYNVSPKLESITWEKPEKAICPEAILSMTNYRHNINFKFVVDDSDKVWDEMFRALDSFWKYQGIRNHTRGVYVMPVGATKQQQKDMELRVAEKALKHGLGFSPRLQCSMYDNAIGK